MIVWSSTKSVVVVLLAVETAAAAAAAAVVRILVMGCWVLAMYARLSVFFGSLVAVEIMSEILLRSKERLALSELCGIRVC